MVTCSQASIFKGLSIETPYFIHGRLLHSLVGIHVTHKFKEDNSSNVINPSTCVCAIIMYLLQPAISGHTCIY